MPRLVALLRLGLVVLVASAISSALARCSFQSRSPAVRLELEGFLRSSGFNCGFVAVSGPGVVGGSAADAFGKAGACFQSAVVSPVVTVAGLKGGVALEVTAGPDRTVAIFAAKGSACQGTPTIADLFADDQSPVVVLGAKTLPLFRDGWVSVPPLTQPVAVDLTKCTGVSTGGTNGAGNGTDVGGTNGTTTGTGSGGQLLSGWGGTTKGYTMPGWSGTHGEARAVARQSTGKMIVVGYANTTGTHYTTYVTRLKTDGTIDTTFGTNGTTTLDYGTNSGTQGAFGNAVAVSGTDDSLFVGATVWQSTAPSGIGVAKLTPGGAVDGTFNGTGGYFVKTLGLSQPLAMKSVAIDPNGEILALGRMGAGAGFQGFVMRLTAMGALDTTFNPSLGYRTVGGNGPDSFLVAATFASPLFYVWGYGASGVSVPPSAMDQTLQLSDGSQQTSIGYYNATADGYTIQSLATQPVSGGSRVLLAGTTGRSPTSMLVQRFTQSGSPDLIGFGTNGVVTVDLGTASATTDTAEAVVAGADGSIYLAGGSVDGSGNDTFVAVGLTPGGSLSSRFGTSGVTRLAGLASGTQGHAVGLALGPDLTSQMVGVGWVDRGAGHEPVIVGLSQ